jgi:hypothetical protein
MVPKDYALIVGIDSYPDTFLGKLEGACNDAADFAKWLVEARGKDVECFTLLSDAQGTTPKLGDLLEEVKKILKLSEGREKRIGRRLYIFLAGHGVGPELDEAALLTVDTDTKSGFLPYLAGRLCANLFRGQALFEEVLLFMDCCRDVDRELPPPAFPFKKNPDHGAHRVKHFYIYATGFGRQSREKDFGGKKYGIFSRALLDGLRGEAADGDGRITGWRLERYLKSHMGGDQSIDPDIDQDLILADGLPPKTAQVTLTLSEPDRGFIVLYLMPKQEIPVMAEDLGGGKRRFPLGVGKIYSFRVLDEHGKVLREENLPIEDADEEVNVQL